MTERQKELLTRAYLKQKEIAELVGASPQSVGRELKQRNVERTRFGYLTADVIKALKLEGFMEVLWKSQ